MPEVDGSKRASDLTLRAATAADLPEIVALLADDALGRTRERLEDPLPDCYRAAFAAIAADPNQELLVAEQDGEVAGCLQLSYLPGLSLQGAWRLQIEGVRVAAGRRGQGLGERMIAHAVERGRARGCRLVQLTSNRSRTDALRFYERLGFVHSHAGLKLDLT